MPLAAQSTWCCPRLPNQRHASPQETGQDPHDRSVTPHAVVSVLRSSMRNWARFIWPKKDVTGNGVHPSTSWTTMFPHKESGKINLTIEWCPVQRCLPILVLGAVLHEVEPDEVHMAVWQHTMLYVEEPGKIHMTIQGCQAQQSPPILFMCCCIGVVLHEDLRNVYMPFLGNQTQRP